MMCYPKVKYVYCTFTRRYRIYFRKTFIGLDTKSINVGMGGSVELQSLSLGSMEPAGTRSR